MLLSLLICTYTLGTRMGISMKTELGDFLAMPSKMWPCSCSSSQVRERSSKFLIDSGVNNTIAELLAGWDVQPLILGWLTAAVIRVCVGSATVAGLTAASIIAPMVSARRDQSQPDGPLRWRREPVVLPCE